MTPEEMRRKRAKGNIACAECRRMKLKCDKNIPCGSCARRGCSSICPHGSLTAGHGSRLVLADTEQLHKKMTQMSERIRVLEDALERVYEQLEPGTTHPLLRKEFMSIKLTVPPSSEEEAKEVVEETAAEGHGALAIAPDGAVQYFGRMAGTEMLFMRAPPDVGDETASYNAVHGFPDPFVLGGYHTLPRQEGLSRLIDFLPSSDRMTTLIQHYFDNAGAFFRPFDRKDMEELVLNPIYHNLPTTGTRKAETCFHPHQFALIYVVFASSALVDMSLPPNSAEAEEYFQLSKVALAMAPVFDETTLWTVLTFGFATSYLHAAEKSRTQMQSATYWNLTCLLAQNLGLHRDPAKWGMPVRDAEIRRRVFWSINSMDHFQTLISGSPTFFPVKRVDCKLPADEEETLGPDGKVRPGYWAWRFIAVRAFVAELNAATTSSSPPSYQVIMAFDSKIREFHKPWQCSDPFDGSPPESSWVVRMQRFIPVLSQYLSLIYLHRTYFSQCCQQYPTRPTRSPYAASYIATYDSAIRVIHLLKDVAQTHMQTVSRLPFLWTHTFTAAVIVGSAIERGPNNAFASSGLIELAHAVGLFEQAAQTLRRARIALPYLTTLLRKAHLAYTVYNIKGVVSPSEEDREVEADLAMFGGQTQLFYPTTWASGARYRSNSPPGPAAVLEAIQSVPALQNPPSLDSQQTPRRRADSAVSGTAVPRVDKLNITPDRSAFPAGSSSSAFFSTTTGLPEGVTNLAGDTNWNTGFTNPAPPDAPSDGQSLPGNIPFGDTWGMSNLMGSVDSTSVDGYHPSMLPAQHLPNDAINLFGLNLSSSSTQMDDSWTTFLRETGLFYDPVSSGEEANVR